MTRTQSAALDPRIVRQASQWWVDLQSDDASASLQHACSTWRAASPEHERAWQRVQMIAGKLHDVPEPLLQATLLPAHPGSRRRAIKTLLVLAGAGAGGLIALRLAPWTDWRADEATKVGQSRNLVLPDGSTVVLNTDTAIDVRFDARERRLVLLRGEIVVITAPDPALNPRDLIVQTAHGTLRPLGTRFLVRQHQDDSELQVYEGAVEVRTEDSRSAAKIIHAGERARFDRVGVIAAGFAQESSASWMRGMLVVTDMPLRAFLVELSRYRRGHLRCDDNVAGLRVSGTFPIADTDRVLHALEYELPVSVQRYTNYWVTLRARG